MRLFEAYTWQHALPVVFFLLLFAGLLILRQSLQPEKRFLPGFILSVVIVLWMSGGTLIKYVQGTFDYHEDLPLYLCRTIAWGMPFAIWYRSRFWLGVFYFWVLAGTFQGIVTPDLEEGFCDYFYVRYWLLHAGLVVTILYAITDLRMRIRWHHFGYAIVLAQFYLVFVHSINFLIGSNYAYTMHKPPASILDAFGPWPIYVLAGELIMIVLFLLLMLPWLKKERLDPVR